MSERSPEQTLRFAVAEFRRATLPQVTAPGAAAAAQTVRGRLYRRTGALIGLVIVLVAAPTAALALGLPGHRSLATAPAPTGTATANPSPSTSQGLIDAPAPMVSLANATVQVPEWSALDATQDCPAGQLTFTDHRYASSGHPAVEIRTAISVDVTGDDVPEVIAVLRCDVGETGPQQVIALDAATGGGYTLLGRVFHTSMDERDVTGLADGGHGTVAVTVGDARLCCAQPASHQLTQVRTFSWSGGMFQQTAGPTTFWADRSVANAALQVTPLSYGAADGNGVRAGALTVVVRNDGPATVDLTLYALLTMAATAGGDWSRCVAPEPLPAGGTVASCPLGTLTAGSSITLRLPVQWPAGPAVPSADGGSLQLRTAGLKFADYQVTVTAG